MLSKHQKAGDRRESYRAAQRTPPRPGEPPHTPAPAPAGPSPLGMRVHAPGPRCSLGTAFPAAGWCHHVVDPDGPPHNFSGLAFAPPFAYFISRQHQAVRTVRSTQVPSQTHHGRVTAERHPRAEARAAPGPTAPALPLRPRPSAPSPHGLQAAHSADCSRPPREGHAVDSVDVHSDGVKCDPRTTNAILHSRVSPWR